MSADEAGRPGPLRWEGEEEDARAARSAADEHARLLAGARGEAITIGNEFSEIRIGRVETRNGSRLLIESTRSGQWVALCPLELEALTWQNTATFSAMIGSPFGPLLPDDAAQDASGPASHDVPDQKAQQDQQDQKEQP